jgi:Domain of unknown function (DUF4340)
MNFRTTVVLIILLTVVAVVLFLTKSAPPPREASTADTHKLIDVNSQDVSKISLAHSDGSKIDFEKRDGDWWITSPVNAPADRYSVDSIATGVSGLSSKDQVDQAPGMDKPDFVVTVTTKDDKSHKLTFGQRSAVGGHMYVRLDDNKKIDVVSDSMYDTLDQPLNKFRDSKLVDAAASTISKVEINQKDKKLVLDKEGTDWKITSPKPMPADTTAVSDITFAIAGLSAVDFAAEDQSTPAKWGLDKPQLTVTFTHTPEPKIPSTQPTTQPTTKPVETTLTFGAFDDVLGKNVFAAVSGSPTVYTVAASVLTSLEKNELDLRDKKVVQINPADVSSISIDLHNPRKPKPVELVRRPEPAPVMMGPEAPATQPSTKPTTGASAEPSTEPTTQSTTQATTRPTTTEVKSKWMMPSEPDTNINDTKVALLLGAFNPLRADKFVETNPATQPSGACDLTIETKSEGATQTYHMTIFDQGTDKPAVVAYNDLVFEVEHTLVSELSADFVKAASAEKTP